MLVANRRKPVNAADGTSHCDAASDFRIHSPNVAKGSWHFSASEIMSGWWFLLPLICLKNIHCILSLFFRTRTYLLPVLTICARNQLVSHAKQSITMQSEHGDGKKRVKGVAKAPSDNLYLLRTKTEHRDTSLENDEPYP
uniref:Uncharacterized protein n=1 Tax=Glossina pallidipes TaxID=7398 RepID=A0A1B0AB62_GLOPL